MNIRWTAEAVANLEDLSLYIAEVNPTAAQKPSMRFLRASKNLLFFQTVGVKGARKALAN